MKPLFRVLVDVIPLAVAVVYSWGVWRSWRNGKLQWRKKYPLLFAVCLTIAAAAMLMLAVVSIAGLMDYL